MAKIKPIALLPSYEQMLSMSLTDYPELKLFLEDGAKWHIEHWNWGCEFLLYIGRNKSKHTFSRFRNEVERFLLWLYLYKEKRLDVLKKADILEYMDFCWKPPLSWIALASYEKFELHNGYYQQNPKWAPFRIKLPKGRIGSTEDKKQYQPSQETMTATFTALIAFYKYLINEEYCYGNPAQVAKKDCKYFVKDAQVKEVKRLTEMQWEYVLNVAVELADSDPKFERSLFVIASLKTLFLRISELSERDGWSPVMSHFWQDSDDNWWLKVFGKGRKIRDISVPLDYLQFLKRYRLTRSLSEVPSTSEMTPIVEKMRGRGGMSSRQLARIVQDIFDIAYEKMVRSEGEEKARKLKEASTHWLRHTGASQEIERGRQLKDLSEDLGHSSMATTDTIYVQTDNKKRAESGKQRKVN